MQELNNQALSEYNDIPVYYCPRCLSLKIKELDGMDYCEDCGNTDIESCHIEEWQTLFKNRYGDFNQKDFKL